MDERPNGSPLMLWDVRRHPPPFPRLPVPNGGRINLTRQWMDMLCQLQPIELQLAHGILVYEMIIISVVAEPHGFRMT